ncbi:hypothetical protein A3D81_01450 [Candidatus Curtissbacteria bacterium RIFCSPHIGHO2_02_FULL_40_17]|uniref:Uncharacterized protein n=2 Tax=Candidatus Curtissiibacteriota TaxID=1752717 RepID=A0A1F5GIN7_9BACT|nr:MAG: hypothetical protein A3D81_01450 [Candidatus Curtissbacteria bacterium RIFCSPHIGHO2_02_FULL_40_17]OGE04967.1 MAG: hypothetical protein A3F45_02435 [Candidatus Curtissbacteria bacterium RIFCSPHIGHO2_12_FULL_41_17]
MDIERRGDTSVIKAGEEEDLRQILRSVAVASFEMARPVGMGWLHHERGSTMTPEEADQFIRDRKGKLELAMDYVQGRQVKTFISQNDQGELEFRTWLFERDRGDSSKLFTRAQEILSGEGIASLPVEAVSTKDQYIGDSLDLLLSQYGQQRQEGESDIAFRTRVFPEVSQSDAIRALEFLFGQSAAEWNQVTETIALKFIRTSPKLRRDLQEFAQKVSEFLQDQLK